ncbi:MAG: nucleoside hydrolase [Chloroflexi bacterium]|nr:nucleoside hydrolase [Chloroflexota bacterium]
MKNLVCTLVLVFLAAACSPSSQSPEATGPAATGPAPTASPAPAGARPILIDTDLAGDDILALMALLREPAVDVRAIAVDGNGEAHCADGVPNVQALLQAFGIDGIPVGCGRDAPGEHGRLFPDEWRAGADAFYGVELPPAEPRPASGAATLIAETAAASPEPLTIVALGPWSNIAAAFSAHPDLPGRLAGIHAMAGAIDVPGNVSIDEVTFEHGVEWNIAVDPDAFAAVLETDVRVTLVPLDATNDVPVPWDFASILEPDRAAAGVNIAFEMYARSPALTYETSFWDTLAALALVNPDLVTWEDLTVRVELGGPSSGRIRRADDGRPIRAAMSADADAFMAGLLAALRRGEPRPEPFELTGTLSVAWDGAACTVEASHGLVAGSARLEVTNGSDAPVAVFLAGVEAPRTWADAVAFVESADLSDPNLAPPEWIIETGSSVTADPGETAVAIATVPAAELGAICATGDWPNLELAPSDSVLVPG